MNQLLRPAVAATLFTLLLTASQAQTTAPNVLPSEVSSAQARVISDLSALKSAQTQFDADKDTAKDTTADLAALQSARLQLRADLQTLDAAAKAFLSADRLAVKADQAQLRTDVVAALNSATISTDKAAVEAAEAKLKTDLAAGDAAAVAADRVALEASRKILANDRTAALSASAAVAAVCPWRWLRHFCGWMHRSSPSRRQRHSVA